MTAARMSRAAEDGGRASALVALTPCRPLAPAVLLRACWQTIGANGRNLSARVGNAGQPAKFFARNCQTGSQTRTSRRHAITEYIQLTVADCIHALLICVAHLVAASFCNERQPRQVGRQLAKLARKGLLPPPHFLTFTPTVKPTQVAHGSTPNLFSSDSDPRVAVK
jgi:hypothetical protein